MNYYRRFPGDYARDTKHLSMLEHAAYTLLLDHLYATEKPISSLAIACRICGATSKSQRNAVREVLSSFFIEVPGGYSNNRFEKEVTHAESRRKSASDNGKKGGRPKPTGLANDNPQESSPDSRLQTPYKEEAKTFSPTHPVGGSPEFLVFWEAYPRKLDRKEAIRAWIKGLCDGSLGEILASLVSWKQTEQWQDIEKIPYPSTWISKQRWRDGPQKAQRTSVTEQKARNTDAAIERFKQRRGIEMAGEVKPTFQN